MVLSWLASHPCPYRIVAIRSINAMAEATVTRAVGPGELRCRVCCGRETALTAPSQSLRLPENGFLVESATACGEAERMAAARAGCRLGDRVASLLSGVTNASPIGDRY